MYCKKCGEKTKDGQKFCIKCGNAFSSDNKEGKTQTEQNFSYSNSKSETPFNLKTIIWTIIIIAIIGFSFYGSLDEESIEKNNEAVLSFDSGDSQQAITQLERASSEAVGKDTKINTLINLGYIYSSESQYEQALQSFKKALTYISENSFDYFLISGEIALLEGKPNAAQISYSKAYELRPNDFQLNNALNLFHLDLEEIAPYYVDYPKALKHAQKAYDVSTSDIKNIARQNLAIAHFFNSNYSQTISLLSSFDFNKEPVLAYWLGLAYAAQEDEVNARLYLQKAIDSGIEVEQEVYDYLNLY